MKIKLLLIGLLASALVFGQTIPGYTPVSGRYHYSLGTANSQSFHAPAGTTPTLPYPAWQRSGAIFVDSVSHRLYFYSQGAWRYSLSGTTGGAFRFGVEDNVGTQDRIFNGAGFDFTLYSKLVQIGDLTSNKAILGLDSAQRLAFLGVDDGSGNTMGFNIDGGTKLLNLNNTGDSYFGDWFGYGNSTFFEVDDEDSSFLFSGGVSGKGKLYMKSNDHLAASNGDVLSLVNKTTGETGWVAGGGLFGKDDILGAENRVFDADGFGVVIQNAVLVQLAVEGAGTAINLAQGGDKSQNFVMQDSIRINPFEGVLNIDSLRSSIDTTTRKPMVWSPATGRWEYLSYWPSGGSGTGTVNTGASGKLTYYPGAGTTVDDVSAWDWNGTTLSNVGNSTTIYTFRVGGFLLQPFAVNNNFLSDNAYHTGATWTRLSAGYAGGFQFYNGQIMMHNINTGSGNFTQAINLKVDHTGATAMGANIIATPGSYTGATFLHNSAGETIRGSITDNGAYTDQVNGNSYQSGKSTWDATITAGGTTGNQTINKPAGTINFAAAATAITITNSLVTTSSLVFAVVRTADATAYIKSCVPGAGSFVITLGAAATAETSVGFWVIN